MTQMDRYQRGRRDGIRWAITYVHAYAKEMNDPGARAALNCVAFYMGNEISPKVLRARSAGLGQSFKNEAEALGKQFRPYEDNPGIGALLRRVFNFR